MPLIEYVDPEEAAAGIREHVQYDHPSGETKVSLLYAVLAQNPEVLEARSTYSRTLRMDGRLEDGLKELAHAVVSLTNETDYCASSHSENLVEEYGVPAEKVRAIANGDNSPFTDRERAVVEFARQTAADPKRVSDEHVERLRGAGFDDADVIELLAFVSYAVASNVIADAMGIHPADRDVDLPDYHPERIDGD
jgi:uncharacterized peroxidase-related enzyme